VPSTEAAATAASDRAPAAEAATAALQSEVDVMRAAMAAAAERVRDSLAAKETALTALDAKARNYKPNLALSVQIRFDLCDRHGML